MPPTKQPKANILKIQVKAFAGDNTENIVEETVMESSHVVTPVVVNHPQTRKIEVKPFVRQHRSTKCAYDITQMDSEQPKTLKIEVKPFVRQHRFTECAYDISKMDSEQPKTLKIKVKPYGAQHAQNIVEQTVAEAPREIYSMDLEELEEKILSSYEEANAAKEMSLEPVDKVNSWDLDSLEETILRSYEKANAVKDNSVKEMSLEPVDKVTLVEVKPTENTVEQRAANPSGSCNPIKSTRENETPLQSFVTLLTVRVMTKFHPVQSQNEERFVKHTKKVVNQTLEGLNIPEDFCPDIKYSDKICKAVTRDLKKYSGKETLRTLIILDSSSVDKALVKALQTHITEVFDELSKKEDSSSWRNCILHVASVIGF
ncbi:uncharacterized protein LOC124060169 [Scomber scombrus]|uniref:Uncharacterized protein LOC124060169 n=1 Tax=Scomber scombrus TaxID=13677 RepID=A0AAV1QIE7_SCOSC